MSWTKVQYEAMQKKAYELGYQLLTPYRKNLKNIRVGVIQVAPKPNNSPKKENPNNV